MLAVCPDASDATSWYRGMGPIGHMMRGKDIDLSCYLVDPRSVKEVKWPSLYPQDVVFLQRPYDNDHLRIAETSKLMGVPLWVDYDDNLFNIPLSNPAFDFFYPDQIRQNIARILTLADAITVSTENLKSVYEKFNKNVVVVNNAIDPNKFKFREKSTGYNDKIIWRGSNTHMGDVMSIAGELTKVANRHPNFEFKFYGNPMWFVTERMPNVKYSKFENILDYFVNLYEECAKGFIIPLAENVFNLSKSNIAWIEATMAGAVSIVPTMPEWNVPGCLSYQTGTQFENALESLIGMNKHKHEAMVYESWNHIMERYNLDVINKQRVEVIRNLLE